jgi:hypothetical protein
MTLARNSMSSQAVAENVGEQALSLAVLARSVSIIY